MVHSSYPAHRIAAALASPTDTFSAKSAIPAFAIDIAGGAILLRDQLSYENGAPGVLCALEASGYSAAVPEYSHFVESHINLIADSCWPDRAGSVQGSVIASHLWNGRGKAWAGIRRYGLRAVRQKLIAGARLIQRAAERGEPLPDFGTYDSMRGFARDALISLAYDEDLSRETLDLITDTLALLLTGDAGPMSVWGPPFVDTRAYTQLKRHYNFGNAHGATGVARVLLFAIQTRRSRGFASARSEAAVTAYCDWIIAESTSGTVPMYSGQSAPRGENAERDIQSRPSWCYGAAGHQALILSAGKLLGRANWVTLAEAELLDAARRSSECEDFGLCHGVAGLMLTLELCGRTADSQVLIDAAHELADSLRHSYSAEGPYGFVYQPKGLPEPAHVPGLLNGAAGILIALSVVERELSPETAFKWLLAQSPWLVMLTMN